MAMDKKKATELLNSFCEYCLYYRQYPVYQLFSAFEQNLSGEVLRYIDDNSSLFIESAGAARCASPEVLDQLRELQQKDFLPY